jgi:membrane-bound lytic murein transglycosylase A
MVSVPPGDAAARTFFENWFAPYAVSDSGTMDGLFTGYYEASLDGARTPSARYATPLHLRPGDLVTVDLGAFRDDLKGERIAGQVVGGKLTPYHDRAAISAGALDGKDLEVVWVDDPVDAFFLHIQGSGRVALDDGSEIRVGYAAQNGHAYTAVGRVLIAEGEVSREAMSMQVIRSWLAANPDRAQALMNQNRSYVFFASLDGDGPLGAQGVALTPGRSLAVDRRFLPLSVPLWLDITAPAENAPGERTLRRLVIAQDTGGAIRGPVRGDLFWGHGEAAANIAGRMKGHGRYYLLLPRTVPAF